MWDMSDERAFMENLICSRFNFFLVFFSIIIGGALTTDNPVLFKIVLSVGALISVPLALTIARAQSKLNIALSDKYLFHEEQEQNANNNHPAKKLDDACKRVSMRNWIGYWIPLICCAILIAGAFSAWEGWLKP